MITALGKEVFSTIEEVVDPSHTALLMIDIQHDFCSPKGLFDRIGKSIDMMAPAIQRVAKLVTAARRIGVLPIFIQNQWLPQNRAVSGSFLSAYKPVAPPRFSTPLLSGGTLTLAWSGYQAVLQQSTDLATWTPVPGNPNPLIVSVSSAPKKFYRLVQ